MKSALERLSDQSRVLNRTITRGRVTAHLEAGHSAQTFADTLTTQERSSIEEVGDILAGAPLRRTIASGRLTFAMIRPRQELGRTGRPDTEVATEILETIQKRGRFRTALHLPWPVSPEAFTEFYGHVKEKLKGLEKDAPDGTPSNIWDLFEKHSTTGATSMLILDAKQLQRKSGHQAWQLWRTFIGATQPSRALPGTLRREYGSGDNNVVHGSDSLAAVRTDIEWMARQLKTSPL